MLRFRDGPIIEKNRHAIVHDEFKWEVDEFLAGNAGLVLAEIELTSDDQRFSRPPWLGREVTDDPPVYD